MTGHDCLDFDPQDPAVRQLGLGAAALRYQMMGYRVLPLARGGKNPHRMLGHQGGVHHATADRGWVEHWWSQDPAAGIGVATGGGLLVWDLDVKHGENGPAVFAAQLAPWLPCDIAATARTPSGGWHLWMRSAAPAVPNRPGVLPGVDAKGDGGYVAAWPSKVMVPAAGQDGGEALVPYEWVSGCPCSLPFVPDEVIRWLGTAQATGSRTSIEGSAPDYEALQQTGLRTGSRNVDLYRFACSAYRRFGLSADGMAAVRGMVDRVLAATDRRDFGPAEVERILASARQFVAARERDDQATWAQYRNNPWVR